MTLSMDALAGAPNTNPMQELTMHTNSTCAPGGATKDRVRPTDWSEFDDMLTCAGEVYDLLQAIWMAAGDNDMPSDATGAIQQVASVAQTRLNGLCHSLEGYMEDARS